MLSFWERDILTVQDLVVVGGGITGLSTAAAYLERCPGKRIMVIERGQWTLGASTRNAGFACFGSLTELLRDQEVMGKEPMLKLVENRWKGLEILRQRLGDAAIGFELVGGYELIKGSDPRIERLGDINKDLQSIFNQPVFSINQRLISDYGFGLDNGTIVQNPLEGYLHPAMMIFSLMRYVQGLGGVILSGHSVKSVSGSSGKFIIDCLNGYDHEKMVVSAQQVAVCTNAFSGTLLPDLDIKPGRGQVLVTSPLEKAPFKGTFHFDEGYYYFRDYGNRVLLGGGRNLDFKGEETTEFGPNEFIIEDLKAKLKHLIMPGKTFEIDMQWSGIMAFGADKSPIVKEIEPGFVVGVRLSGMGIALGSLVGSQLVNLLTR